ncbi:MAG: hypothetical protein PHV51_04775 [Methanosarcinaceae archaeon]|nr:hypothetical protein [Methanosarcinaceae archaeon]
MAEKLHIKILELLAEKQLSISGIYRELKAGGMDEHRLILTGYLRALRDLDMVTEIDVPPSKIYSSPEAEILVEGAETPFYPDSAESKEGDIYALIRVRLMKVELELRIPVGVYVISKLFERPCFHQELKLVGITPKHLKKFFEKPGVVREVPDADLKGCRAEISRIKLPSSDPGYEVRKANEEISGLANELLLEILKEKIDFDGLVPKTKQTKLI